MHDLGGGEIQGVRPPSELCFGTSEIEWAYIMYTLQTLSYYKVARFLGLKFDLKRPHLSKKVCRSLCCLVKRWCGLVLALRADFPLDFFNQFILFMFVND